MEDQKKKKQKEVDKINGISMSKARAERMAKMKRPEPVVVKQIGSYVCFTITRG